MLRNPDVREEASYGCSMVLAYGQVFTLEASEARAPHSRYTSNSTHDMYSRVNRSRTAQSVKGAQGARLDFGMHEHRLEFGIAERTTSTSAQHKFELESVGLVLGGPAGAAPSDVLTRQPAVAARLCCSWSYRAPGLTTS